MVTYMNLAGLIGISLLGLALIGCGWYIANKFIKTTKEKDVIEEEKDIHVQATKDLVRTVETIKPYLDNSDRTKLFGNHAEPGIIEKGIHNDITNQIINDIRSSDKVDRGFGLAPSINSVSQPTLKEKEPNNTQMVKKTILS